MKKKIVFTFVMSLGLSVCACAQDTSDTLTITTYYPSPYGVYGTLKLHPRRTPTGQCQEGELYYHNEDPVGLHVCNETRQWQPIGAGGGEGYWHYNGTNNALTVTNTSWGVSIGSDTASWFNDGELLVNSPTGQGALSISGISDGGATWSGIYLNDNVADLTNTWVIAFKKRTGFPDENDLLIGKWDWPNAYTAIRIDNATRNVGIGNIDPTQKLDVAGSIRATGNITAANNMYAQAFFYSSDGSLKRNIRDLQASLEKVLQLKGQVFEWKSDGRPDVGLIAQDVEKVFPELVATDERTGLKSVEYGNLVAVLVEAVKELQGQIQHQQRQIQRLNSEIADLKQER